MIIGELKGDKKTLEDFHYLSVFYLPFKFHFFLNLFASSAFLAYWIREHLQLSPNFLRMVVIL